MRSKDIDMALSMIRAILHEAEAILNDFQEGKQSNRVITFASPRDSDPVKARKGVTRAIIDIDRLRQEMNE